MGWMALLLRRASAATTADFSSAGRTAAWQFTALLSGDVAVLKAQTKKAGRQPDSEPG
jgi:hypothetical protein